MELVDFTLPQDSTYTIKFTEKELRHLYSLLYVFECPKNVGKNYAGHYLLRGVEDILPDDVTYQVRQIADDTLYVSDKNKIHYL